MSYYKYDILIIWFPMCECDIYAYVYCTNLSDKRLFFLCKMQDYLLNCWEEKPCIARILNEEIIAVSWLQSCGMVLVYVHNISLSSD